MSDLNVIVIQNRFTLRERWRRLSRRVQWGAVGSLGVGMCIGAVIGAVLMAWAR